MNYKFLLAGTASLCLTSALAGQAKPSTPGQPPSTQTTLRIMQKQTEVALENFDNTCTSKAPCTIVYEESPALNSAYDMLKRQLDFVDTITRTPINRTTATGAGRGKKTVPEKIGTKITATMYSKKGALPPTKSTPAAERSPRTEASTAGKKVEKQAQVEPPRPTVSVAGSQEALPASSNVDISTTQSKLGTQPIFNNINNAISALQINFENLQRITKNLWFLDQAKSIIEQSNSLIPQMKLIFAKNSTIPNRSATKFSLLISLGEHATKTRNLLMQALSILAYALEASATSGGNQAAMDVITQIAKQFQIIRDAIRTIDAQVDAVLFDTSKNEDNNKTASRNAYQAEQQATNALQQAQQLHSALKVELLIKQSNKDKAPAHNSVQTIRQNINNAISAMSTNFDQLKREYPFRDTSSILEQARSLITQSQNLMPNFHQEIDKATTSSEVNKWVSLALIRECAVKTRHLLMQAISIQLDARSKMGGLAFHKIDDKEVSNIAAQITPCLKNIQNAMDTIDAQENAVRMGTNQDNNQALSTSQQALDQAIAALQQAQSLQGALQEAVGKAWLSS